MTLMYHAQEKIINVPGAETSGKRGGIHNSVTRAVTKPTHMIGGYAQLSYGFNYYGTVGSNRDEFVLVRKMKNIDWLEGPLKETALDEPVTPPQSGVRTGPTRAPVPETAERTETVVAMNVPAPKGA
jgi:nitrate reductase / nitrite oxidoreductase, alpha subunit